MIDRLAADLRDDFPEMTCPSPGNLNMRAFAELNLPARYLKVIETL
ncbi:hypothetical protein [Rhizobium sp. P40RR-XXII]|nr:hypothetical protein [Rhizobium sp. P40RR-XXII]